MLSPSSRAPAPVQQQVEPTCEQDLRRPTAKVRPFDACPPRPFPVTPLWALPRTRCLHNAASTIESAAPWQSRGFAIL
jgi:hypothetical protein